MRAAFALAAVASCALLVCLVLTSSQAISSGSDSFTVLRPVRAPLPRPLGLASTLHFPPLPSPSVASLAQSAAAPSRPTPAAPPSVESEEAQLARIQAQVVARIQESGLRQSSASAASAPSAKAAAAPAPLLSQSQIDSKTVELSKGKAASKDGLLQAQQHLNKLKQEEGVLTHELAKVPHCPHSHAAADASLRFCPPCRL